MNITEITWDYIERFVQMVADKCGEDIPTGVYGLPRGGLVPAVMLSHKLGVPLLAAPSRGCLVVDDIADSGDSLIHYARMGYDIAVVICKADCPVKPKYSYTTFTDNWIKFPWECQSMSDTIADADNYYCKKGRNRL